MIDITQCLGHTQPLCEWCENCIKDIENEHCPHYIKVTIHLCYVYDRDEAKQEYQEVNHNG